VSRAGIFIGVDRVGGGFPVLNDAAAGAKRMHRWAIAQGIVARTHAILITDTPRKPVTHNRILKAITRIVDGAGVEQLILYFSGHGVNVNNTERWLLSNAPEDATAAVDLAASVDMARYLVGNQHIVVISDACRVAPGGLQIQGVRGASVFPNRYDADKSRTVDQLFACALGRPANEVRDTGLGATHKSLYTEALLDALTGKNGEVLVKESDGYYVRIPHLQAFLESEVPHRVAGLGLAGKVNQNPDANRPMSTAWLARHESPAALRTRAGRAAIPRTPQAPPSLDVVVDEGLNWAVTGGPRLETLSLAVDPVVESMMATEATLKPAFGHDQHESRCGIKVRGAQIANCFAAQAQAEQLSDDDVRVWIGAEAVSVLLEFTNGTGTVIPAIPDYYAGLTVIDGELVDVAYEPTSNSQRWPEYHAHREELRRLRAVAAAASVNGRFRLDGPEATGIAARMRYAKTVDPGLAIYAAYAYHELAAVDRIRDMAGYLRDEPGVALLDLELLSRSLFRKQVPRAVGGVPLVPFVPMLAQGWPLVAAHGIGMPPALSGIDATVRQSLWSLYDPIGVDKLRRALESGEVR
jgi:hypothetical protein